MDWTHIYKKINCIPVFCHTQVLSVMIKIMKGKESFEASVYMSADPRQVMQVIEVLWENNMTGRDCL